MVQVSMRRAILIENRKMHAILKERPFLKGTGIASQRAKEFSNKVLLRYARYCLKSEALEWEVIQDPVSIRFYVTTNFTKRV